ncbi:MAG: MlaD family protein [Candidatus Melainabacteria bacterium]
MSTFTPTPYTARVSANPLTLLSDMVLWLLLIALMVGGLYFGYLKPREARTQKITISLKDANEIAKGSIVRMMGTDVGTVSAISILPDHVNITIKTFPEAMKIPSGSVATINFTGLVGAKSIEITPPALPRPKVSGKTHVLSEEPIRIIDAFNYQTDIAQALRRGAENMSTFFSQKKSVAQAKQDILFAERSVQNANTQVGQFNENIHQTKDRFGSDVAEAASAVSNFSQVVKEARPATEPDSMGPAMWRGLNRVGIGIVNTHAALTTYRVEDRLAQANATMLDWSGRAGTSAIHVRNTDLLSPVGRAEQGLQTAQPTLDRIQRLLQANIHDSLTRFHEGVLSFNRFLQRWLPRPSPAAPPADRDP